jgi:hypothetical protein
MKTSHGKMRFHDYSSVPRGHRESKRSWYHKPYENSLESLRESKVTSNTRKNNDTATNQDTEKNVIQKNFEVAPEQDIRLSCNKIIIKSSQGKTSPVVESNRTQHKQNLESHRSIH